MSDDITAVVAPGLQLRDHVHSLDTSPPNTATTFAEDPVAA